MDSQTPAAANRCEKVEMRAATASLARHDTNISCQRMLSMLNTVDEVLNDIRAGRMVVIVDDEDRENAAT